MRVGFLQTISLSSETKLIFFNFLLIYYFLKGFNKIISYLFHHCIGDTVYFVHTYALEIVFPKIDQIRCLIFNCSQTIKCLILFCFLKKKNNFILDVINILAYFAHIVKTDMYTGNNGFYLRQPRVLRSAPRKELEVSGS